MSKISMKSKLSNRSLLRQKKSKIDNIKNKKDNGFCCGTGDYDPLFKYDQRNPPFKSSLTCIQSVHECPVLKFRTQFFELINTFPKKKGFKPRRKFSKVQLQWIDTGKLPSAPGTLQRFLEDDIEMIISKNAFEKQEIFEKEGQRNIQLSIKRAEVKKNKRNKRITTNTPRWYQDFSNSQMKHLLVLRNSMCEDFQDNETNRTHNTLMKIGIISPFFKLTSDEIKSLQRRSNIRPIQFLREVYKIISGIDFESEGHKEDYNCNERLTLSAIAFLSLPETIIELNNRLPPIKIPKIPFKPEPPKVEYPQKMDDPYKEKLFLPPNLRLYRAKLHDWREKCKSIPRPKSILPPEEKLTECDQQEINIEIEENNEQNEPISFPKIHKQPIQSRRKKDEKTVGKINFKPKDSSRSEVHNVNLKSGKEKFDFNLSGLGKRDGPVEYKISGTLDPTPQKFKSWLGEKEPKYIISGICNDDTEPPQYPVTFELTGVANVTPNNSNEEFFSKLKIGDGPKKIYPRGRQNLSKNWQQWLQNVDEEFFKFENHANKLIESVEATMKLVVPGPTCDSCCACRQVRKENIKRHATKTPHMVIESIAEDPEKNKYIMGSVAMHSPAPSLVESTINLLEVVASHDTVKKHLLINGVTNDDGKTIYYISGITKDTEHIPEKKIDKIVPKSVKNALPCACAIEKMFNEGLDQELSDDNITEDGICPGKKYRPEHGPAYSCKKYPSNKTCCRNPFQKAIKETKKKIEVEKTDFYPFEEQNMYSLPAFQPCGYGMTICEGSSEVINIPDEDKLQDFDRQDSQISGRILKTQKGSMNLLNQKNRQDSKSPVKRSSKKDSMNIKEKKTENFEDTAEPKIDLKRKRSNSHLESNNAKNKKPRSDQEPSNHNKTNSNESQTKSSDKIVLSNSDKNKSTDRSKKSSLTASNKDENQRLSNPKKAEKLTKKTKDELKQEQLTKLKEEMDNFKMLPEFEVQPVIIPEKPKFCRREEGNENSECCNSQTFFEEDDQVAKKEGPFGWRTSSEKRLAPEKTLIYLTEPLRPVEMVPVRPGGKPCHCRENRNKKKIPKYNIGGMQSQSSGRNRKNVTQIIEGLTYVTPPQSPRRSDEHIPEYELYESPYDTCARNEKNLTSLFMEKHVGIRSKEPEKKSCETSALLENETKIDLLETSSLKLEDAFKDHGLMEFYSKGPNKVPCWIKCPKFVKKNNKKSRKLQVKKPVCECKYERKIVKKIEDDKKKLERQKRLKSCKKVPVTHVGGISRPMEPNKRFIISGVQKIANENGNNNVQYCVSGIAENYQMGPVQYLIEGIRLQTPVVTPVASEIGSLKSNSAVVEESENLKKSDEDKKKENRLRKSDLKAGKLKKFVNRKFKIREEAEKKSKGKRKELKSFNYKKEVFDEKDASGRVVNKSLEIIEKKTDLYPNQNEMQLNVAYPEGQHLQASRETKNVEEHNPDDKLDLTQLVNQELKKMSAEGFIFAKLPECDKFPQIHYWLMYREGVYFSEMDKRILIQSNLKTWAKLKKYNRTIKTPSMNLTKNEIPKLTFGTVFKLKNKIASKKEQYYKQIRENRVRRSADSWNTMEFGKFPNLSFKNTFFTYLSEKDVDGHILEPG